jgi:hypothetical protein
MRAGICFALMCCATSLAAQLPDSAQADSAKMLPEITVTVTPGRNAYLGMEIGWARD